MQEVTNASQFVDTKTGEVLTISQITARDRSVSIPVGISAEGMFNAGFALIRSTTAPVGDVVVQIAPTAADDGYYDQAWEVRAFTVEERTAKFEQDRQAALANVTVLRTAALTAGVPLLIAGSIYRFGVSTSNRVDYQEMAKRAQADIEAGTPEKITRTYDLGENSFDLPATSAVSFTEAALAGYREIWNAAATLRDAIVAATQETGLPAAVEAIEINARGVQ